MQRASQNCQSISAGEWPWGDQDTESTLLCVLGIWEDTEMCWELEAQRCASE